MLADCTDVPERVIEMESSLYIGTQEIDKGNDAMRIRLLIRKIFRPPHLPAGIRRHEFCPNYFNDMKPVGVSQVIVGKIAPG